MHHHSSTMHRRAPGRDRERGAGLVEYALLIALIAVVCISAVTFLGKQDSKKFDKVGSAISSGGPGRVLMLDQQTDLCYWSDAPSVEFDCP